MAYIGNKPPVVSNLITDLKIGEDAQTKIDFETADEIHFYAANAHEITLAANELSPNTSDGIALGTGSKMWADLFLASGGVMNFNNGNVTMTHSADTLTVVGATVAFTASTAVTVSNDLKLASDSAVLGFGADNDTTLTHTDGTGLTLNSTNKLTFGDAASFIQQSSNGVLRIDGEATIDLNASTEVNVSAALTVGGRVVTDDSTNATSTTDGSLQTDGGLSVVLDAIFGDDVSLLSDSAVINMGAGNDVTFTHDGTTGATITGTPMVYESKGASALANDTHTGLVLEFIAHENLVTGNAVYVHTDDGEVAKAQADAVTTMPAIGVVMADANANNPVKVLVQGVYNDSNGFGGDLTEGAIMYVDDDTAGLVTATIPDADGEFVQRVGIAVGPRDVYISPSLDVIERD